MLNLKSNVAAFDKRLEKLSKVPRREAGKALRAGAQIVAKAAQADAPVGKQTVNRRRANPKKRLKASIKVRTLRSRGGAGVRVKVSITAPHGHFVTLGTKPRSRARIGGFLAWRGSLQQRINRSTGSGGMKPNPFFRRADAARKKTFEVLEAEMMKAKAQP